MTDFPLWALIAVPFVAAFLALAGHGTIAWVAIKRFFQRVSKRIDGLQSLANEVLVDVEAVKEHVGAGKKEILEVRTEVSGRIGGLKAEVEGRIEALEVALGQSLGRSTAGLESRFDGLRGELDAFRASFATQSEALSKQVQEVEERLGGRLPSDLPGLLDTKLAEYDRKLIAREASVEASVQATIRKEADVLRADPTLTASQGGQRFLQAIDAAALPKTWQRRLGIARALLGVAAPPAPGTPNGGLNIAPAPALPPAAPPKVPEGAG